MATKTNSALRAATTRDALLRAVRLATKACPWRTTLPVLSYLRIEARGDRLVVDGTDLDVRLTAEAPAEVEGTGATCVPARRLLQLLEAADPGPVWLYMRGTRIAVETGEAVAEFNVIAANGFPDPADVGGKGWAVPASVLQTIRDRVAYAVSESEFRPILKGIHLAFDAGRVAAVATNGHQMARVELHTGRDAPECSFILRPAMLALVLDAVGDEEVDVRISVDGLKVRMRVAGGPTVVGRAIEGPYPNYEQVIPSQWVTEVVTDRARLTGAMTRTLVMASDQTHRTVLRVRDGEVAIGADQPDLGRAAEWLAVETTGDPMEIGVNAEYLLAHLKALPEGAVRLRLVAPERAILIDAPADPTMLCLLMPLRLLDDDVELPRRREVVHAQG